jgi:hypothetical protein
MKTVGNSLYMLLTIFCMVMVALVIFVLAGCTVASGYRAFDLLSKGEIRKGLFEVFSFFYLVAGSSGRFNRPSGRQ